MASDIIFKASRDAPKQAWLAKLSVSNLVLVGGENVRHETDWFFEGGWARTDSPRLLRSDGVYLGSGGVWDGDTLSLITPSHTAEAVYIAVTSEAIFASNSLPFMLVGTGV